MNLPEGYSLKHESPFAVLYANEEERVAEFLLDGAVIGTIEEIRDAIEKSAWRHYDMKNIKDLKE